MSDAVNCNGTVHMAWFLGLFQAYTYFSKTVRLSILYLYLSHIWLHNRTVLDVISRDMTAEQLGMFIPDFELSMGQTHHSKNVSGLYY